MKKCWKLAILQKIKQKFEKSLTNFSWNFEIWAVQRIANLVDLEKCWKLNAYLDAKIGVDTEENELSKVCWSKQAIPTPGHKSGSVQLRHFLQVDGRVVPGRQIEDLKFIILVLLRNLADRLLHLQCAWVPLQLGQSGQIDRDGIAVTFRKDALALHARCDHYLGIGDGSWCPGGLVDIHQRLH